MKNFIVLVLFLFAGSTLKAQSNNTEDLQKMLVGTWEPQHRKIPGRIQTLVFFADGVVNFNYSETKKVQRYKVSKTNQGFDVEVVEMINGKPLDRFHIQHLNESEMQIGYLDETKEYTLKFKKVSS